MSQVPPIGGGDQKVKTLSSVCNKVEIKAGMMTNSATVFSTLFDEFATFQLNSIFTHLLTALGANPGSNWLVGNGAPGSYFISQNVNYVENFLLLAQLHTSPPDPIQHTQDRYCKTVTRNAPKSHHVLGAVYRKVEIVALVKGRFC